VPEDGEEAVLEGQNMPLQDIVAPLQQSLLPLPIDGSGQPLLSQESTSSFTVQVPIDEVGKETVLEGQIMQTQDMGSFRSRSCISRAGRYPSRLAALSIRWCRSISSLGIEWPPPVSFPSLSFCNLGVNLRSWSFHFHNHHFPLLVVVIINILSLSPNMMYALHTGMPMYERCDYR